jgi:hypothetical protein
MNQCLSKVEQAQKSDGLREEKNNEVACLCSLSGLANDLGWLPALPELPVAWLASQVA